MRMTGTNNEQGHYRRIAASALFLAVIALVFCSIFSISVIGANADERDDALAQQQTKEQEIEDLRSELEGLDADLADLFIEAEETQRELEQAEDDLAQAEDDLAVAERHYQQLVEQLEDAEALKQELETEIETSKDKESELTSAVGSMARDIYRGNSISPFEVVINMQDLGEISDRAAAASALSRAQSKALDDVRTGIVVAENQAEKQDAVTTRITELTEQAEEAYHAAEDAKQKVADRLADLETKRAEQEDAQKAWEARRGEAQVQIQTAEDERLTAVQKIAEIDRKRAKESGDPGSNGQPNSPPPSSGGMFANPFRFNAPVTSYFGYRVHPIFGDLRLHDGTDFGAGCGTTQYATRAGTVIDTGRTGGGGNYVTINHGVTNGHSYITSHLHLQNGGILVSPGQTVTTSTPIGLTGSTGNSTGCHLHLILYLDGTPVSILPYM